MQRRNRWIYFTALGIVALSGCSGDSHKSHGSGQAALSRMLYSPNGEPLNGGSLGRPTCQEALSHWFERVDKNNDGAISRDEFMADATLQFSRMDIDKNGYLVSEEIERFRRPYRQQTAAEGAAHAQSGNASEPRQGKHNRGGGPRSGRGDTGDNEQNTPGDNTADPVMSADTDLDFKVTLDEFMAHAQKIFLELDGNHDAMLSRDEVLTRCNPK